MTTLDEAKRMIVEANRVLAHQKVVDAFGHVSMRHPEDPTKFLLARSLSPADVEAEDIMTFDLDGTVVGDDDRKPYVERFIHGAVFEAQPETNSVVHNHAYELLPFSVSKTPLRPILHTAGVIGPLVPIWDIHDKFGDTNMLLSSIEQGRDFAKTMGNNNTALMRGHGGVVSGTDTISAVLTAIYLMINAEALYKALQLGEVTYLTPGETELTVEGLIGPLAAQRAWAYLLRQAGC
jgi:HCOMODA/2-hydroxy-3-carboxy-muconic semialdehyde decarboxylase